MADEPKPEPVQLRVERQTPLKVGEKFDVMGHVLRVRKITKKDLFCARVTPGKQPLTIGTGFGLRGLWYDIKKVVRGELVIRKRPTIATVRRVEKPTSS